MVKQTEVKVIPTSFTLAGSDWKVIETDHFVDMGMCYPEECTIRIRAGLSNQSKEATFYHELVHAVLFSMGKNNHDEEFVETFGGFLHQFARTKV